MDWKPKVGILADTAESEPTKPSKPGFVGFEGATSTESREIEAAPDPEELARASAVLNRAGVRIMAVEGGATIGVWSDLDGPEVRAALRAFGSDGLPVRYLDGACIPMKYKLRGVEGEPVPTTVLAEMERHKTGPWQVRDRMLTEMGCRSKEMDWEGWKALALNRLFNEDGVTGRPGRITAATVRHGEQTVASDTESGSDTGSRTGARRKCRVIQNETATDDRAVGAGDAESRIAPAGSFAGPERLL
jgi:hypothetical protein